MLKLPTSVWGKLAYRHTDPCNPGSNVKLRFVRKPTQDEVAFDFSEFSEGNAEKALWKLKASWKKVMVDSWTWSAKVCSQVNMMRINVIQAVEVESYIILNVTRWTWRKTSPIVLLNHRLRVIYRQKQETQPLEHLTINQKLSNIGKVTTSQWDKFSFKNTAVYLDAGSI